MPCPPQRQQTPIVAIPRILDVLAFNDFCVSEKATDKEASDSDLEAVHISTSVEEYSSLARVGNPRDAEAPVPYQRLGNVPIMLSPAKYGKALSADAPYVDVREEDAHPWLSPLLWRCWKSSSQGLNSADGFKSGRSVHARAPLRGPPLCKDLEWTYVLEHLNPNRRLMQAIPSPFISTSSRLVWLLRKALRERDHSSCISLIDTSALDRMAVYYVPPFHTELQRHMVFDNGAQYYKGISEHLVWDEISTAAMIKTFAIGEFCQFVDRNADVKRLLRLDKVIAKDKFDVVTRGLKRDRLKITDSVAAAIAELVMYFGLDHTSSKEMLSHLVYEIAQGWALVPDVVSGSYWQVKARWFTHAICRKSTEPVSFAEQAKVYYA